LRHFAPVEESWWGIEDYACRARGVRIPQANEIERVLAHFPRTQRPARILILGTRLARVIAHSIINVDYSNAQIRAKEHV